MRFRNKVFYGGILSAVLLGGCTPEEIHVPDNPVPPYDGVPTLLVDAYVTRAYIDLIGREPLTEELEADRALLRAGDLGMTARLDLVDRLMGSDPVYLPLHDRKLSDDLSSRFLEGSSREAMEAEEEMWRNLATQDSLQGNILSYLYFKNLADRMKRTLDAVPAFRAGTLGWREVCRRHCDNNFYDDINMNSFNFINATFDDLFGRYPTEAEFEQAYAAVEFGTPSLLFGAPISGKLEYLDALVADPEFTEGAVRWWAEKLLVRPISSAEVVSWSGVVGTEVDIRPLQRLLVASDEYADFQ